MVTADQTRAHLARRARERREALERRDARWRALLPAVADDLRAAGARRVWLFGSLARGDTHEESDVDLLVEGLPDDRVARCADAAWERLGAQVDLVRRESAPAALVERVDAEGVEL